MPNVYQKLVEMENHSLEEQIRVDVISERSMLKSQSTTQSTVKVADTDKIIRVIRAYGNLDIGFGYTQGYNYIVTLLLLFIEDEEKAFFCLVSLMSHLNWREFYVKGMPRALVLQETLPSQL